MFKEKVINIPNTLTLLRLIAIPFFVIALFSERSVTALAIFILLVIGDAVDGYLARALKQTTNFGKAFDGIVDGVLLAVVLVSLLMLDKISLLWVIVLLAPKAVNFVLQATYSKIKEKVVAVKTTLGRISTGLLYLTIILIIIDYKYRLYALIITAVLVYIAGIRHALAIKKYLAIKK